jgi:hypothetical protein
VSLLKPNWYDERVYDDLWRRVFRPARRAVGLIGHCGRSFANVSAGGRRQKLLLISTVSNVSA